MASSSLRCDGRPPPPFEAAVSAIRAAADAYLLSGMRADVGALTHLDEEGTEWRQSMKRQLGPKWWIAWPGHERSAFLDDMARISRYYHEHRLLNPHSARMPDAESEHASPTLYRMRSSFNRVKYLAQEISNRVTGPGPSYQWFSLHVERQTSAEEFDEELHVSRAAVVREFELRFAQVQRESRPVPPVLPDPQAFGALADLLGQVRLKRQSKERAATLKALTTMRKPGRPPSESYDSHATAAAIRRLDWWANRSGIQGALDDALQALFRDSPSASPAQIQHAVMVALNRLRDGDRAATLRSLARSGTEHKELSPRQQVVYQQRRVRY
ncbi:hypothetical protein DMC30DRAFT_394938 [Rhodotorula diobovata]|uniref:Uncharacterized protein n=1 Tax=Rhodotorula diobovata TaxID=5288 RepID=A0A5C5G0F2_9BASI|nr:hypothetical protein DMC30DRAFT_394938 [Rhodotorula diobovata]